MGTLDTKNRFDDPDKAYRMLIDAHRGLSAEESADLNTRLVLVLANQVGDRAILEQAVKCAMASLKLTDESAQK